MLCEKCFKKVATTFKKINENEEIYICNDCASNLDQLQNLKVVLSTEKGEKSCKCGTTFFEISESSLVGCKDCYKTFESELAPIISKIHSGSVHVGKRPVSKIEKLETQIENAMKNRFYDLAKKLSEQLETLKEGTNV